MGFAMADQLDKAFARLAGSPQDKDLSGLERAVWAEIDGQRQAATVSLPRALRWSAVSLALAIGVTTGGAAAALTRAQPAADMAVFSVHSHLSPSTLLGDRG